MTMTIKVLGPGCHNCIILDRVILAGRVPTPRALRTILTDAADT